MGNWRCALFCTHCCLRRHGIDEKQLDTIRITIVWVVCLFNLIDVSKFLLYFLAALSRSNYRCGKRYDSKFKFIFPTPPYKWNDFFLKPHSFQSTLISEILISEETWYVRDHLTEMTPWMTLTNPLWIYNLAVTALTLLSTKPDLFSTKTQQKS